MTACLVWAYAFWPADNLTVLCMNACAVDGCQFSHFSNDWQTSLSRNRPILAYISKACTRLSKSCSACPYWTIVHDLPTMPPSLALFCYIQHPTGLTARATPFDLCIVQDRSFDNPIQLSCIHCIQWHCEDHIGSNAWKSLTDLVYSCDTPNKCHLQHSSTQQCTGSFPRQAVLLPIHSGVTHVGLKIVLHRKPQWLIHTRPTLSMQKHSWHHDKGGAQVDIKGNLVEPGDTCALRQYWLAGPAPVWANCSGVWPRTAHARSPRSPSQHALLQHGVLALAQVSPGVCAAVQALPAPVLPAHAFR